MPDTDTATTPRATGAPAPDTGAVYTHGTVVGYRRTPHDVLRLVVFGVTAIALYALAKWASDSVLGLEQDLVRLVTFLSPPVERILAGTLQVLTGLTLLAVWITPILRRRYRLFGYIVVVNVLTSALVGAGVWWLDRSSPVLLN